MTRLAILADIHANLPALEAAIADLTPHAPDHVIVVGDVINWGPFSLQVLERLQALGWSLMRGNHEYYLLDHQTPRAPAHWVTYDTPPWLNHIIPPAWKARIAAWPESLSLRYPDAPPVRLFHASPANVWTGIYPKQPEADVLPMLDGVEEDLLIVGHTHLPMDKRVGRWRILNPGAVGVPLDGKHLARYLLLDAVDGAWQPTFKQVPFNQHANLDAFAAMHIEDVLGATGTMLIAEYESARPRVYPFMAWWKAQHKGEPLTVALAQQFLAEAVHDEQYIPNDYRLENISEP